MQFYEIEFTWDRLDADEIHPGLTIWFRSPEFQWPKSQPMFGKPRPPYRIDDGMACYQIRHPSGWYCRRVDPPPRLRADPTDRSGSLHEFRQWMLGDGLRRFLQQCRSPVPTLAA
jgi:hypothetical protein